MAQTALALHREPAPTEFERIFSVSLMHRIGYRVLRFATAPLNAEQLPPVVDPHVSVDEVNEAYGRLLQEQRVSESRHPRHASSYVEFNGDNVPSYLHPLLSQGGEHPLTYCKAHLMQFDTLPSFSSLEVLAIIVGETQGPGDLKFLYRIPYQGEVRSPGT